MTKSLKSLWARFLFQDRGILPSRRLLVLFLVFSCGAVLLSFFGISWLWLLIIDSLFIAVSLLDLLLSPRKKQLAYARTIPEELERGKSSTVKIEIKNNSSHSCIVNLKDGLPQSFHAPFPVSGSVKPQSSVMTAYQTIAPVRGKYELKKLYVRYRSVLGLWQKQTTPAITDTVKVIPDLSQTRQYLEDAQKFLMDQGAKIRKHKSGEGEFSKIREYVVGDDPRKINWRQTAKLQEVMTNDYEPEHGKYITILIDCGRMMGAELKKENRLEKALEAAMTVSAAALDNGDYVSVLAFSKDVKCFVPPAKGMDHLQKILEAIYNLEVDASESNYAAVFNYIQSTQKKRSLLLLFSDIHTFLHEETPLSYLQRLRRKHYFLMIGIEDQALTARAKQAPENVQIAMMKSMAQQQIQVKKQRKNHWERQGLSIVEAKEERLATAAVSRYVHIMNQGLL
ncbi:MAG TPA: DUF58 domain-containing protein [Bacillales bacterium]